MTVQDVSLHRDTVNFKTEKISYKVKSSEKKTEEKQAVFEDTHESIIDLATWERMQELRKRRQEKGA